MSYYELKKDLLVKEINQIKQNIKAILNNDGDSSPNDPDILLYKKILKEKEDEYNNFYK